MNLKRSIGAAVVMTTAMLVVSASAGATTGIGGYRDAAERGGVAATGVDAIAYFRANELSTLVQSAGPAAIAYFAANERATTGPGSYVDVGMRGQPVGGSSSLVVSEPTLASGFDWGDAAVGASSAVMLALLIGGTFVLVRHSRGRELAR
jgi:hypothetical protein